MRLNFAYCVPGLSRLSLVAGTRGGGKRDSVNIYGLADAGLGSPSTRRAAASLSTLLGANKTRPRTGRASLRAHYALLFFIRTVVRIRSYQRRRGSHCSFSGTDLRPASDDISAAGCGGKMPLLSHNSFGEKCPSTPMCFLSSPPNMFSLSLLKFSPHFCNKKESMGKHAE